MGAATVLDYHQANWPEQVRSLTNGGVEAAANAARSGAAETVKAVRDGGRLATITADPPAAERGITVLAVQVVPNGRRLGRLVQLLAQGTLTVSVGERFPLKQGAAALAHALRGSHGTAIVLRPGGWFSPEPLVICQQAGWSGQIRNVGWSMPRWTLAKAWSRLVLKRMCWPAVWMSVKQRCSGW